MLMLMVQWVVLVHFRDDRPMLGLASPRFINASLSKSHIRHLLLRDVPKLLLAEPGSDPSIITSSSFCLNTSRAALARSRTRLRKQ